MRVRWDAGLARSGLFARTFGHLHMRSQGPSLPRHLPDSIMLSIELRLRGDLCHFTEIRVGIARKTSNSRFQEPYSGVHLIEPLMVATVSRVIMPAPLILRAAVLKMPARAFPEMAKEAPSVTVPTATDGEPRWTHRQRMCCPQPSRPAPLLFHSNAVT
jgi:hypothetical protein